MRARLLHPAVAAGVLGLMAATVGVAGAAPAKPKPVCNLVQDAKDDTFAARYQETAGAYGPQESSLDIVSADLASDAKTLTGVLRVQSLAAAPATSPGGASYDINFTTPSIEAPLYVRAL